jgi:hypothetical protein
VANDLFAAAGAANRICRPAAIFRFGAGCHGLVRCVWLIAVWAAGIWRG